MNVLYLGVNNPVTIAASGYDADELEVSIDNGNIRGENGQYIINPGHPGAAFVTVSHKGKEIQQTEFRVKEVPNPVATVKTSNGYTTSGIITREDLLKVNEVVVMMQNFDFDLSFDVQSFTVSAIVQGYSKDFHSSSNKLTEEQKALLNALKEGDKVYIENIYAKGPSGSERKLNTISLKIE